MAPTPGRRTGRVRLMYVHHYPCMPPCEYLNSLANRSPSLSLQNPHRLRRRRKSPRKSPRPSAEPNRPNSTASYGPRRTYTTFMTMRTLPDRFLLQRITSDVSLFRGAVECPTQAGIQTHRHCSQSQPTNSYASIIFCRRCQRRYEKTGVERG